MRARKLDRKRKRRPPLTCAVCKQNTCVDEVPKVIFKINPGYRGRITRSVTKILDYITEFILVETYRCMPLLGDEHEIAPDWDIHIVRYTIVFTRKHLNSNVY